jgi:hypothetical protein
MNPIRDDSSKVETQVRKLHLSSARGYRGATYEFVCSFTNGRLLLGLPPRIRNHQSKIASVLLECHQWCPQRFWVPTTSVWGSGQTGPQRLWWTVRFFHNVTTQFVLFSRSDSGVLLTVINAQVSDSTICRLQYVFNVSNRLARIGSV